MLNRATEPSRVELSPSAHTLTHLPLFPILSNSRAHLQPRLQRHSRNVVALKIIQVEERFEIAQCPQSSYGLGFGEDKFFRNFIPWRNSAGERLWPAYAVA